MASDDLCLKMMACISPMKAPRMVVLGAFSISKRSSFYRRAFFYNEKSSREQAGEASVQGADQPFDIVSLEGQRGTQLEYVAVGTGH